MHKTLYLYSFHTSVYPSLLAERISVFVQQLHHSSIFGLQAPFLGAELYNIKRLASQAEIRGGKYAWKGNVTHVAHSVRPNTSKPHLALGLGALHPERDIDAPM